jgi:hypothetical protein
MTDEQKRLLADLRVRLVAIEGQITSPQVKIMVALALENLDELIVSIGDPT